MKKDMFYNYDKAHHSKVKPCPEFTPDTYPDTLYSWTDAEIVHDVKGNEIGVRAYKDSDTTLYFQIIGAVDNQCPIDFLNRCSIKFELIDAYDRSLYQKEFMNEVDSYGVLEVKLAHDDLANAGIKKDIYRIKLSATIIPENGTILDEAESFILFYENDSTISFI